MYPRKNIMSYYRFASAVKTGFLALGLWCVALSPAQAEPLAKAVEAALNNHPAVEAAIANRNALAQEAREQWADHFPTLNIRGAGGRVFGDNSTSRGLQVTRDSTYSYLWEGSVTLTQPLFDGFETFNRVDAAQFRRESANFTIMDVREELALRTVLAYLDVLRSRESLARLSGHGKTVEDYQNRIQAMVDEGAADESMIVQARDIRAQLDNTIADIEGQLKAANATYMELVGAMPGDPMELPVPPVDMIPAGVQEAVDYASRHHPALRAAARTEEALSYDVEAEKQAYFPDVNGEVSYLKRDQREEIGGEVIDAKAVVRLNWDISVAGGQISRVRKSQYRRFESKAQRAETERQIVRDVRIAYSDLATAQRQLAVLRDRMEINNDLFETYEAQFEGARINLLQLLQADNARFNTALSLMNGEFRMLASQYSVLASMGQLQNGLNIVAARTDQN